MKIKDVIMGIEDAHQSFEVEELHMPFYIVELKSKSKPQFTHERVELGWSLLPFIRQ
jgi:hypothetical protein